jgi:serine/threonine-protein kinase
MYGNSKYVNIYLEKNFAFEPIGNANFRWGQPALTISPDGKILVYVARIQDNTILIKHSLESFVSEPIKGTEGAFHPFFSPDCKWIGFFTKKELWKIKVTGSEAIKIIDVPLGMGADWGPDDRILFSQKEGAELIMVDSDGRNIQKIPTKGSTYFFPDILPGGTHALVCTITDAIFVMDLSTGEMKRLLDEGIYAKYLNGGYILFSKDGDVFIAEFDRKKFEIIGQAKSVLDNIRIEALTGVFHIDVSNDGTLVFSEGKSLMESKFVWKHRSGKEEDVGYEGEVFGHYRLSPDGKKIAVVIHGRENHIWIYDIEKGVPERLTFNGDNTSCYWSPDNQRIAYRSRIDNQYKILLKSVSGNEEIQTLLSSEESMWLNGISPDNNYLIYNKNSNNIYKLNLQSGNTTLIRETDGPVSLGMISTDGKYFAYTMEKTGQYEVYILDLNKKIKPIQITFGGADPVIFSKNTKELFYRNDRRFYLITYSSGPEFDWNTPKLLFEGNYLNIWGMDFDVSPDGRKFLFLKSVDENFNLYKFNVITNWFSELKDMFD